VASPATDFSPDPKGFKRRLENLTDGFVDLGNRYRRGRRAAWISDLPDVLDGGSPQASPASRLAATTVFLRSMAIVIGPTPPGTGVM
jgi:hypothetical protein